MTPKPYTEEDVEAVEKFIINSSWSWHETAKKLLDLLDSRGWRSRNTLLSPEYNYMDAFNDDIVYRKFDAQKLAAAFPDLVAQIKAEERERLAREFELTDQDLTFKAANVAKLIKSNRVPSFTKMEG